MRSEIKILFEKMTPWEILLKNSHGNMIPWEILLTMGKFIKTFSWYYECGNISSNIPTVMTRWENLLKNSHGNMISWKNGVRMYVCNCGNIYPNIPAGRTPWENFLQNSHDNMTPLAKHT